MIPPNLWKRSNLYTQSQILRRQELLGEKNVSLVSVIL